MPNTVSPTATAHRLRSDYLEVKFKRRRSGVALVRLAYVTITAIRTGAYAGYCDVLTDEGETLTVGCGLVIPLATGVRWRMMMFDWGGWQLDDRVPLQEP